MPLEDVRKILLSKKCFVLAYTLKTSLPDIRKASLSDNFVNCVTAAAIADLEVNSLKRPGSLPTRSLERVQRNLSYHERFITVTRVASHVCKLFTEIRSP